MNTFYAVHENKICPLLYLYNDNKLLSCRWIIKNSFDDILKKFDNKKWKFFEDQLDKYFDKKLREFQIDFSFNKITSFREKILLELLKIPYGSIITYKELADRINNPGAVRAVGRACKNNPLPVIIPCHRVVSQRGIGGYMGKKEKSTELTIKEKLLKIEGVII